MNDFTLSPKQEPRYACILFDSTFKAIICTPENEDLLIEIIELLIPGKHISHITFLNSEKHGFVVSEKSVTFDLLCKDDDTGEEFLVEVQNSDQKSYRDRVLAYATYPIREQLATKLSTLKEHGQKFGMDYSLKPIYVISLVNFNFDHEDEMALEDGYISRYELRNKHNSEVLTPNLNFIFLELDRLKFAPNEWQKCNGLLEKFVFSMKYMHKLSEVPDSFEDRLLGRLFFAAELANMTIVERENYENRMRTELDRIAELDFAREAGKAEARAEGRKAGLAEGKAEGLAEGKAEGLAEGKAKGLAEGKAKGLAEGKAKGLAEGKAKGLAEGKAEGLAQAARAMLAEKLQPSVISKCTGIPEEKLKEL